MFAQQQGSYPLDHLSSQKPHCIQQSFLLVLPTLNTVHSSEKSFRRMINEIMSKEVKSDSKYLLLLLICFKWE